MTASLLRRGLAELLGTGLLVTVVVGSGIAAQRLSNDAGLQLLENAVVTAAGLPVLILMFGPSAAVTSTRSCLRFDWLLGRRDGTGLSTVHLAVYLAVQTTGAIAGALLANAMFAVPLGWSTHERSGSNLWVGEVVATAGLLIVIVSLVQSGKANQTPWAVGAYIGSAYWFTSSTSFANPAVSVGRAFSDTFAGIAPSSLPGSSLRKSLALGSG